MRQIKTRGIPAGAPAAFLPLLILTAAICLAAPACTGGNEGAAAKKKAPAVEIAAAEAKTVTRSIELTGTIEAAEVARIASPAEGPVLDCSIREGDTVKQGQVVLTIGRRRAAEDRVKAAREQLAREKEDLRRIEKLVRSGSIPGEQSEDARLRVSRAEAELTQTLESMEDYRIRAPWAGIVSRVLVTDGGFVSPRETLMEIFDPKSLILRFAVPEKELEFIRVGMTLSATFETWGGRAFPAEITRLYPELDRNTRTRLIEASLLEKTEVVPGMFARISLPVETVEEAVMIPDQSIIVTPRGETVVFVIEDGKAFRREVRLGIEHDRMVQITEGIRSGDVVVVAGNQKLQDGMEVSIPGGKPSPAPEKKEESIR